MRSVSHNVFARLAVICIVVAVLALTVSAISDYHTLKAKRDALAAQVTAAEDRNAALRSRLAEEVDDDYIVRVAREKLDLHLPEEIVFYNDIQ